MIKRYRITVSGQAYDVEVEELTEGAVPKAPAAVAPRPAVPAALAAPAAPTVAAGNGLVQAPMPGTIMAVKVTVGQAVKRGDVLLTLEAMKMENEIACPRDGRVKDIVARPCAAVNTGDPLVVIE